MNNLAGKDEQSVLNRKFAGSLCRLLTSMAS